MGAEEFATLLQNTMLAYNNYNANTLKEINDYQNQNQKLQQHQEEPKSATHLKMRMTMRFDTYENWLMSDVVLLQGELAIAHDTLLDKMYLKCGDGTRTWVHLPFIGN